MVQQLKQYTKKKKKFSFSATQKQKKQKKTKLYLTKHDDGISLMNRSKRSEISNPRSSDICSSSQKKLKRKG